MNQKEFELNFEKMISSAPLVELIHLFESKKKEYSNNKMKLWLQKLKDKFTKNNLSKFIELGYRSFDGFDFLRKVFDLGIKFQRDDFVEYLFTSNYIDKMIYGSYLSRLVESPKILKKILSNKKLNAKFTEFEYYEILNTVSYKNCVESFDIIIKVGFEKIKKININLQKNIILNAMNHSATDIFLKLIKMNEPLKFDINLKQDHYGIQQERKNLLILAAKNNNIKMIEYLLTSSELKEHAKLEESIYWIIDLPNGKEIIDTIIFEIKAPLTPELEKYLENNKLLEIFKKRDFMLTMEKNLPKSKQTNKMTKI